MSPGKTRARGLNVARAFHLVTMSLEKARENPAGVVVIVHKQNSQTLLNRGECLRELCLPGAGAACESALL